MMELTTTSSRSVSIICRKDLQYHQIFWIMWHKVYKVRVGKLKWGGTVKISPSASNRAFESQTFSCQRKHLFAKLWLLWKWTVTVCGGEGGPPPTNQTDGDSEQPSCYLGNSLRQFQNSPWDQANTKQSYLFQIVGSGQYIFKFQLECEVRIRKGWKLIP